jgi:uncharacterized protein (TIGR03000 family)
MKTLFLSAFPALGLLLCACGTSPAQFYYGPGVGPLYGNPYGFRSGGIGYSYNFNAPVFTYGLGYGYAPGLGYRYGVYPGARFGYSPYLYRYQVYPSLYRRSWDSSGVDYHPLMGYAPPAPSDDDLTEGNLSETRRAFYPPGPLRAGRTSEGKEAAPRRARALLTMRVPADAELWFGDYKSKQTGAERTFQTPPLEAGAKYTYKVRMRWMEGGKPREITREIDVRAGENRTIDLLKEEGTK